jgi:hypothetical protein
MGRQPDGLEKLLALAKANGYKRGEYKEKYADPRPYNYIRKIIYDQDCALCCYMM